MKLKQPCLSLACNERANAQANPRLNCASGGQRVELLPAAEEPRSKLRGVSEVPFSHDMFSMFQQLCALTSGSRPFSLTPLLPPFSVSRAAHTLLNAPPPHLELFIATSIKTLLLSPPLTPIPGAQSRDYIWASNTPDDTELYGSTLRYPVEQTGAPYNLA